MQDLQKVLHHEMDVRGTQYWVGEWYRGYYGQPGLQRAVADYQAHTSLIGNLGAELTRAVNLIIYRAARAELEQCADLPLATIYAVADDYAIPAQYSAKEREIAQPYPGLHGLPEVLPTRADGSFGVGKSNDAPTVAQLNRWVAEIEQRWGPGAQAPPDTRTDELPPTMLLPPEAQRQAGSPAHRTSVEAAARSALAALAAAGVIIQIATAPAILIGAATGAALGAAAVFRTHWRWPPPPRPTAVVVVAVLIGAAAATFFAHRRDNGVSDRAVRPPNATTVPPKHAPSGERPSEPLLNSHATCASVRGARDDGRRPYTVFVDSPGQLASGGRSLVGRVIPSGKYTQVVRVNSGDQVKLSIGLHNTEYGSVDNVVLRARLAAYGKGCWRVTAASRSRTEDGGTATFGPVLIVWPAGQASGLEYVHRSTELLDENGGVLGRLRDGLVAAGVPVPYAIPGGTTYFVNCLVRVL